MFYRLLNMIFSFRLFVWVRNFFETYQILKYVSLKTRDFFFIQVGANDGKTGDPIYKYIRKYDWKGILIEPVPYLFQRLKLNYQDRSGLVFENVAISDEDSFKTFYRIKENHDLGHLVWYDQIGSFNKEVVLKHRWRVRNFDKNLIEEKVPTVAFKTLLVKHRVEKIDLLHIDTEGYDFEIIKLAIAENVKPRMIFYEHYHLTSQDKINCEKLLRQNGYEVLEMLKNSFAFQ